MLATFDGKMLSDLSKEELIEALNIVHDQYENKARLNRELRECYDKIIAIQEKGLSRRYENEDIDEQ